MADNGRPAVVVTGIGLVSSLGIGKEDTWNALREGRSGAGPITRFDTDGFRVHAACEAGDFAAEDFMSTRVARRIDLFAQFGVAAAQLAVADAGIEIGDGERVGAVIGSGAGGAATREAQMRTMLERGPDRVSPLAIPASVPNMAAAQVSLDLGIRGPVMAPCTACASGTDAIGLGAATLRRGAADVVLAGGAEALVTPYWVAGFDAMTVLSRREGDPAAVSHPYSAERDGFLIGEAGAVLVLERAEDARARGATPLAAIAGYGASADAYHLTDPDPSGVPQALAVSMAIADSGLDPESFDYVNSHGGASQPGDPAEIRALRTALGEEHAKGVLVSTTKPIHGHCMGAAGALEASITVMAMTDGWVPATRNLETPDDDCAGVEHVRGADGIEVDVAAAISTSFGLGGQNAAIAIARPDLVNAD